MPGVPTCFIWQVCNPSGHRPVKKELFKEPNVMTAHARSYWERTVPRALLPERVPTATGSMRVGNLFEEQYRYYQGEPRTGAFFAKCRYCGDTVSVASGLITHKDKGCCHRIDVVCARLRADGLCVMCDTKTPVLRWGIPICAGGDCDNKFRFTGDDSEAWIAAVDLVKRMNVGEKIGHVTLHS